MNSSALHCLSKPNNMSFATTTMIFLSLQIITCFLFTTTASSPHGLTIDLIRHHPNSSSSRRLSETELGSPYADTLFNTANYLMKLQIGTPPVEIIAELDTGSDILWTQCMPCVNCYDQPNPIFDPSKSSTFKEQRCDTPDKSCPYEIIYADQSYSRGTLATETVTLHTSSGEPFVMPETIIGCGHNNSGFSQTPSSGIVGLDLGAKSLISQMGEQYRLISYCFSGTGTSKINFGDNAVVAGDGTVAADMFIKNDKPYFYYLNLDAVSIGDTRIETLGTPFHATDGNIVIDSGTTYTYLPESFCSQVKEAVMNVVAAERVADPTNNNMLCYNSNTVDIFPEITMHFARYADLVLDKHSMYVESTMGGYFCLSIVCNTDPTQLVVFGNRAQNNFLVGYDASSSVVSFSPTDCSALWS